MKTQGGAHIHKERERERERQREKEGLLRIFTLGSFAHLIMYNEGCNKKILM